MSLLGLRPLLRTPERRRRLEARRGPQPPASGRPQDEEPLRFPPPPGGAAGLGDKGSSNVMGTDPVWPSTAKRLAAWWQSEEHAPLLQVDFQQTAPVVVVTGFVATLEQGSPQPAEDMRPTPCRRAARHPPPSTV